MPNDFIQTKQTIKAVCSAFDDAGNDFERLSEDLLREFGFFNVRRQRTGGVQFGRDFTADLEDPDGGEPTHWYLECKNLKDAISTGEVAPKLIWHLSADRLTGGFVIVGISPLSNELHELLERTEFPFSIFNWSDDNFVKLVALCPVTRMRWFPMLSFSASETELAQWRAHLLRPASSGYEMRSPLRLSLAAEFDPPHEYAYFIRNGHFEKWPTDFSFSHVLSLFNACRWPLIVRSIRLRTLRYRELPERILVELKAKGLEYPRVLKYVPSPVDGGEVEMLPQHSVISLAYRETDSHHLELTRPVVPGCYDVQVIVRYDGNGRTWSVEGPSLRLCVCTVAVDEADHSDGNLLRLHVFQKHYDRLARRVLDFSQSEWQRLKDRKQDELITLGPTFNDVLERRPTAWTIQRVPMVNKQRKADSSIVYQLGDGQVVLDLGDVPDEKPPEDPYDHIDRVSALYRIPVGQLYGPPPSVAATSNPQSRDSTMVDPSMQWALEMGWELGQPGSLPTSLKDIAERVRVVEEFETRVCRKWDTSSPDLWRASLSLLASDIAKEPGLIPDVVEERERKSILLRLWSGCLSGAKLIALKTRNGETTPDYRARIATQFEMLATHDPIFGAGVVAASAFLAGRGQPYSFEGVPNGALVRGEVDRER